MKFPFVVAAGAMLLCAGCVLIPVPRTFVSAPQISGRLVDSSGRGVQGAVVHFEGRAESQVKTDQGGRFTLRREHDLVLFGVVTPCPVYKFPEPRAFPGAIVVEDSRYGKVTIPLKPYYKKTQFDSNDLKVELGEVNLGQQKENNAPIESAARTS